MYKSIRRSVCTTEWPYKNREKCSSWKTQTLMVTPQESPSSDVNSDSNCSSTSLQMLFIHNRTV